MVVAGLVVVTRRGTVGGLVVTRVWALGGFVMSRVRRMRRSRRLMASRMMRLSSRRMVMVPRRGALGVDDADHGDDEEGYKKDDGGPTHHCER